MKKMIITLFAIGWVTISTTSMAAMSVSKVRTNARFLTDRMAYELNMNTAQYNDAYEINYDFIYNVRHIMDDVVRGSEYALDNYYRCLDLRNDDLRWVLSHSQYNRFVKQEHFYRPIYASGGSWNFRMYVVFHNHNHFYFSKPHHYRTYSGAHFRANHHTSFYHNKYKHKVYNGHFSTRRENVYVNHRRADFGASARPVSTAGKGKSKTVVNNKNVRSSVSSKNDRRESRSRNSDGSRSTGSRR